MRKLILSLFFTFQIAEISAQSTLDQNFNINGIGPDKPVYTSTIQPDGKILIGGKFRSYNGIPCNRIARLNANGTLDVTFNSGTGADSSVNVIKVQSDGKILVGGDFIKFNNISKRSFVRLNADGSIDPNFSTGTGVNYAVYDIAIQTDNRIIIAGAFTTVNGNSSRSVARLNITGSLDVTFFPGTGANNTVGRVHIQSDGKIILTGSFTTYYGMAANHLVRLTSTGILDNTFTAATEAGSSVFSSYLQKDDKLIIGGMFSMINGTAKNNIARLNTNGTLDATFNVGTGLDNPFNAILITPNDKIIIGGSFTSYNNVARAKLAVLNMDGSLDSALNSLEKFNDRIEYISLQTDDKIIITGGFDNYAGAEYIARIGLLPTGLEDEQANPVEGLLIYPNPNNGSFTIKNDYAQQLKLVNSEGVTVKIIQTTDADTKVSVSDMDIGMYYITSDKNPAKSVKVLVAR